MFTTIADVFEGSWGLVTLIIDWYELNRNSQFSHSRDLQEFPGKNRGPFPAMPSLEAAHLHQSIT